MTYITSKNGSRQPMFLVTTGILLLLSTIAVSLRLYCRIHYIRHVGLDDYFMLIALVVAIALGIMNGFHISWGTGQHGADLDLFVILVPTLKHWYAYQLVYPWALFFVKASILALYHRIFTQTKFRYTVYAVTGFVTTYTVVVFFVNAFECRSQPSRAWSPSFPRGCNNLPATYFSTASINILTDAMILIMPLRAFQQLNLHRRKRFALMGVFMVGGIAVIASIVRLYALWVYTTTQDVAYDAIFILLLSQIEVNVAIISASAPALRPLFNKTFMSSSYNRSNKYGTGYGGDGPASNIFSGNRTRSKGQIELRSFSNNHHDKRQKIMRANDNRSTSEEHILGGEGITKTVDINVERNESQQVRQP
ncbi:hypothetical protein EK21DRAFT_111573 [Setomelanomma holmii]|uniref:Rhodopsin domain-containing protein n=1 Tax=Setomelanomma holmii TaxID=210430 RepID=A0A9P4HCS9_9PLEO|nr:hypothetical protein EK21DRAFT_111573 [Setomelanomma holmii]